MEELIEKMEEALKAVFDSLAAMRQRVGHPRCIFRGCMRAGKPKKMKVGADLHLIDVLVCQHHWEKVKGQKRFQVQTPMNRVRWVAGSPLTPED